MARSDREILDTVSLLARHEGIFAEPASATTIAAINPSVEWHDVNYRSNR